MSDIGERVKKIVVDNLGVDPDKVTENASFIEDLGADSLDTGNNLNGIESRSAQIDKDRSGVTRHTFDGRA